MQDPEYYGEIYADPFKFDRVYTMDMAIRVTEDGGKTDHGGGLAGPPDNHALTFDPTDPLHLLVGNDGGLWESYDQGRTWRHFNNIPVTQFYRVTVDNGLPFYNIYGGAQDNGSQGVPSRTMNRAGIRTSDWMNTGGGDGYQSRVDPQDPDTVYACSQNIGCKRLDLKTGVSTSIHPRFATRETRSRWDVPFIISPHSHTRLYIAGNRLMRSDDRGTTWKLVSPRHHAQHRPRHDPGDGKGLGSGRGVEERVHAIRTARARRWPNRPSRRACSSSALTTGW